MVATIRQLRNFDAEQADLVDLVAIKKAGELVLAGFEEIGAEAPVWLVNAVDAVDRATKARVRDELMRQRSQVEQSIEQLKTPSEKRKDLMARLEQLDKRLA